MPAIVWQVRLMRDDGPMRGPLTPEQQLATLAKIWGNDRDGFIFLPWIRGGSKTKDERRSGYNEGPAFEWPVDRDKVLAHLSDHADDDVYFTPCLFEDTRRIEACAAVERTLWADLDEVDPEDLKGGHRPTIAWESSPGRYQAVWLLQLPRTGLSWAGGINHRLTKYVDADPSGWDTTQLLRVPGRPNFKFQYKESNAGQPVEGSLLWDNGPRYVIEDFDDLPEIPVVEMPDTDLMDEDVLKGIDRHDVWGKVRLKVSMKVREYMGFRSVRQITDDMDRSEIQWQIMCDLADAGCSVSEIVAVIRPTVWNSYAGRRDELKRLKIGAGKAVAKVKAIADEGGDDGGALEILDDEKPDVRWLTDVMTVRLRRPRWLVNQVWSESGCGFIAGDPKSYKSWFALDMALSVATGTNFLNDPAMGVVGGPRPMLYLQEEDSEIIVRDRLEHIVEGKCPTRHWYGHVEFGAGEVFWNPPEDDIPLGFHVRTGFVASDPGWQAWLADMVNQHMFGGVIIDTLGTTAGDVDTDRAQDLMGKILRPMREIAHTTDTAITIVHHNRKGTNGGDRGGQRMLGSVALHAWVDDAMYVHSRENMPGGKTKVRVERESKATTEHRWVVEVPRMGWNANGTRTMWEPVTGLWDASEGAGATDVPPTRGDGPVHLNGGRGSRPGGKRIAGTNALTRVRQLGGTEAKPATIARLAEAHGVSEPAMWKQVASALANGLLAGDKDRGVYPKP